MGQINNDEELKYFLAKVDYLFLNEAYQVLFDSKEDPHHSAVFLENIVHCYLRICKLFHQNYSINTVHEFFNYMGMTKDEIYEFESLQKKESSYYYGPQYDPERGFWFKNEFNDDKDKRKVTGVVIMKGPYSH